MWEIHMLGLTRRELETDPRGTAPVLDPTDEAGAGDGLSGTAPAFDPTCGGLEVKFLRSTRLVTHFDN